MGKFSSNLLIFVRAQLIYFLCVFMVLYPALPSFAGGVTVDPSSGSTSVGSSNGVDVININAPSASGVSHNKYTDYNVGSNGLIINNAGHNGYGNSQLSGQDIGANANLGGKSAGIILNAVTGNHRSEIKGTNEIYGQKADLIIAKPDGIAIPGDGFIHVE